MYAGRLALRFGARCGGGQGGHSDGERENRYPLAGAAVHRAVQRHLQMCAQGTDSNNHTVT
eukprot:9375273-Pyramimonas_sp.AAC.1